MTPISTASANDSDDIDRRILESHVEITIEADNCSDSADDPSSPLLTSSQNEDSSPPSSIATSPESSTDAGKRYSTSPTTLRSRRHGYTFHDGYSSDIGDTDDGAGDAPGEEYPQAQPSRGRPQIRGDGSITVRSVTDPVIPLALNARKKSNKGLSRFKSIRSISSSFRHNSKTKTQDSVNESDTAPKVTSKAMPTRSRSRNPFRAFRRRKSSRNHAEMIETTPVLHSHDFCDSFEDEPIYLEKPVLPPRKASLRHWRSFTDPEQIQWENTSSCHNTRSRAPSPTGSWSQNHLDYRGEPEVPRWELPTHKDISFDTQPVLSDFEVERTAGFNVENATLPATAVPGTPDSFKVHPLRARIEGIETFDLGLDVTSPTKQEKEEVRDMEDQACVVEEHVQMIGVAQAPEVEATCKTLSSEGASLQSEQPEETQPEQEQGQLLLEPEQIVSLYGPPKKADDKEQAETGDQVPEVVAQKEVPVDEVHEEDSGSTTPPGSPSPAHRDMLPTRPLHPPRKSSLRRLTGFNHTVMPFADFEFPMPVLASAESKTDAADEGRLSR